jgi:hypothetical protein
MTRQALPGPIGGASARGSFYVTSIRLDRVPPRPPHAQSGARVCCWCVHARSRGHGHASGHGHGSGGPSVRVGIDGRVCVLGHLVDCLDGVDGLGLGHHDLDELLNGLRGVGGDHLLLLGDSAGDLRNTGLCNHHSLGDLDGLGLIDGLGNHDRLRNLDRLCLVRWASAVSERVFQGPTDR